MSNYELRPATKDDYDFLWEVTITTMRDYVTAIWGWDETWQAERFRSNFHPELWQVIVVEGTSAGAFEVMRKSSEVFLAKLFIMPEFQRGGIGSSVVRSLITEAQSKNLPFKLDVLKSNPDAKRMYERLGLCVTDENDERFYMSTTKDQELESRMITIQRQASRMTHNALDALFSSARHVPDTKLNWTPMGEARSVQNILTECALSTPFYIAALDGTVSGLTNDMPDKDTRKLRDDRLNLCGDLDGVEAVARETFAELCGAIEKVPDERLADNLVHPMDPIKQVTTADLLFLAYWNVVYHTGQINYLQMMLGDIYRRI